MIYLFTPALINNTGEQSHNLGDLMIHEAVLRELANIFPQQEIKCISSHAAIPIRAIKLRSGDLCFVGGSNLLSSEMIRHAQWRITLLDILRINNVILFGVGWWQYQRPPNFYTRFLLRSILSTRIAHSVRDSYTAKMLEHVPIRNVMNTGCPTMWPLEGRDFDQISDEKSKCVLVMLTDYKKDALSDKRLLELINTHYDQIYFWPQGRRDLEYFSGLDLNTPVTVLGRSIDELDQFLASRLEFDYIGTRLHGGIRCIINNRRSLILEVDNRAREIKRDTGMPCIDRADIDSIRDWIITPAHTNIHLNSSAINEWKNQFIDLQ